MVSAGVKKGTSGWGPAPGQGRRWEVLGTVEKQKEDPVAPGAQWARRGTTRDKDEQQTGVTSGGTFGQREAGSEFCAGRDTARGEASAGYQLTAAAQVQTWEDGAQRQALEMELNASVELTDFGMN